MEVSLFRKEASAGLQRAFHGEINLATPMSHFAWAVGALVSLAIVLAWLVLGSYSRRQQVTGTLVPIGGLADVQARASGTVTRVWVTEGDVVRKGDPLVTTSAERVSEKRGGTDAVISQQLDAERSQLRNGMRLTKDEELEQRRALRERIESLERQRRHLQEQLAVQREQVSIQTDILRRISPLLDRGYVSALQVQQIESGKLDAEAQSKSLDREMEAIGQQVSDARAQLIQLPMSTRSKLADLDREVAKTEESTAQYEADRSEIIRATSTGVVTSVMAREGQATSSGQTMVTLAPDSAPLQAELLVPSSAIGFVKPGSRVALHIQAYPYQKFGTLSGDVVRISRSALKPNEIASLNGGPADSQPMYRIVAHIDSQSMEALGHREPLQAGMATDADLILERRSIIEWIFEPLYGFTRR